MEAYDSSTDSELDEESSESNGEDTCSKNDNGENRAITSQCT